MTAPATPEQPRIVDLAIQPGSTLRITWQDGSRSSHDLPPLVTDQPWAVALLDAAVFRAAELRDDGWQIVWPGTEVALSARGLWDDVHPPPPTAKFMAAAEFTAWLRECGWSFAQAGEALGVSKRMLKCYAAGTHDIPKTVWLACMHLAAEQSRRRNAERRAQRKAARPVAAT